MDKMAIGSTCYDVTWNNYKKIYMRFIKIAIKYFKGEMTSPAENVYFDECMDKLQIGLYFGLVGMAIIMMIKMIIDAK
jgi:hypothetical protein